MGELEHYGVKGMKWGVRKVRKRIGQTVRNLNRSHYNFVQRFNKASYDSADEFLKLHFGKSLKIGVKGGLSASKEWAREFLDSFKDVEISEIRFNDSASKTNVLKPGGKIVDYKKH